MPLPDFVERIYRAANADREPARVTLFCKALYAFFILKVIASWSTWELMIQYHAPRVYSTLPSRVIFMPALWATHHLDLFCWLLLSLLAVGIGARLNYFVALLIWWMAVNTHKLNFPVMNGSDLVFLMLISFSVLMCAYPQLLNPFWRSMQRQGLFFSVWACRIQIALIYFFSGADKLFSPLWRSGDAIGHISNAGHFFNPGMTWMGSLGPVANVCLAWLTIAFELGFASLVWFRTLRPWLLAIGVVFHIFIWIFLSLPDFGLVMIVSYLIFLESGRDKQKTA